MAVSHSSGISSFGSMSYSFSELLELCDGYIVPTVPNLQLFHYIFVYGRYGVSRYVYACVCVVSHEPGLGEEAL